MVTWVAADPSRKKKRKKKDRPIVLIFVLIAGAAEVGGRGEKKEKKKRGRLFSPAVGDSVHSAKNQRTPDLTPLNREREGKGKKRSSILFQLSSCRCFPRVHGEPPARVLSRGVQREEKGGKKGKEKTSPPSLSSPYFTLLGPPPLSMRRPSERREGEDRGKGEERKEKKRTSDSLGTSRSMKGSPPRTVACVKKVMREGEGKGEGKEKEEPHYLPIITYLTCAE